VILAGGFGSRISEESQLRPKPMVEIGGRPILWHIMKIYSHFGLTNFVICLGYKGYVIKEYFSNYFLHMSDVTFHMDQHAVEYHRKRAEPWKVTLVDTGEATMTGGRIKRISEFLDDEAFCMTYGDGVADIDIRALIGFHEQHGRKATVTAVKPPGRYGALELADDGRSVQAFKEKPSGDGNRINGGFFVLSPAVLDLIEDDGSVWEQEPMRALAGAGELVAFEHDGFWQPMDTLREKNLLDGLVKRREAPWMLWD